MSGYEAACWKPEGQLAACAILVEFYQHRILPPVLRTAIARPDAGPAVNNI
ncbi:hypothetical protein ACFLXO_05685 [Chloroflexota bacterium]